MLTMKIPALFIGHGSPMNAIEDTPVRRSWQAMTKRTPRPKSVLCISAHWETHGVHVTASPKPDTIHDFGGFPKALFDTQYPAPGDPELAVRVVELVKPEPVNLDKSRGLDHGVWSALIAMYPDADVPVVQLSLDMSKSPQAHYDLAARLAPLRDEGILIIGSGNIVHNLRVFFAHGHMSFDWARRFNDAAKDRITRGDHDALIAYEQLDKEALLSVPTPEHYLPVLYTLGVLEDGESVSFFADDDPDDFFMTSFIAGA